MISNGVIFVTGRSCAELEIAENGENGSSGFCHCRRVNWYLRTVAEGSCSPNPLGQPLRHDVRSVWTSCWCSVLFIVRDSFSWPKSYLVYCKHSQDKLLLVTGIRNRKFFKCEMAEKFVLFTRDYQLWFFSHTVQCAKTDRIFLYSTAPARAVEPHC